MLLVISPAKTLDYESKTTTSVFTQPEFLDAARQLVERARRYSEADLMELMEISQAIAKLNVQRFAEWHTPFTPKNAKQAVLAFKGDVYEGLDAASLNQADLDFAQAHLRVLSGLYGVLRPLDLMQAYRLEMGRKVDNERGKNLYEFWGESITQALNAQMKTIKSDCLINLASNEYFKVVKTKLLNAQIITPEFKDYKNGEYKMMGVYAKRARGLMSRFVIQQRITSPEQLKEFTSEGYKFNPELSKGSNWVFSRRK